jgi:Ribosomal protein S7p/S5e
MPRRREIAKRELLPDALYQSPLVTKFINTIMSEGKRSLRPDQGALGRRSPQGLQEGR